MRKQANQHNTSGANLCFFGGREDRVFEGMQANLVADMLSGKPLPSVVVGGLRRGAPEKWATVIPTVITDAPVFNKYGKIIRGSIVKVGDDKRNVIVSHKEGNDWYVLVRTGLRVGQQGMMGDMMQILSQGEGAICSHGAYSFDKGQGAFQIASTRSEMADFGKVAAEKVFSSPSGKKIPLLKCPESSFSLWRVPVDAVLIVRDINGKLTRLVGGTTRLQVVDASGYSKFFDELDHAHRQPKKKIQASAEN